MEQALKKRNKFLYRNMLTAYTMILPAFLLLVVFVFIPLIIAIMQSFTHSDTGKFVWFFNFYYILSSAAFLQSFINVFIMSTIVTVTMIIISFLFAHVLKNIQKRFSSFVRTVIFLPYLISGIVASIIFLFMFNYTGGLLNYINYLLGKDAIGFATQGIWPYISIIVPTIWLGFGYNTLVMYAGLQNIPKSYYEAAEIDGAGRLAKLIYITIPNMKNYFILIIIGLTASGLQMFELPLMITQGGPMTIGFDGSIVQKTLTPVLFLVNNFKGDRPQNTIIAGALLVMIIIAAVNFSVFKIVRSEKSQDA